MDKLNVALAN